MDSVGFDYDLTGAGFCDATFRVGDAELTATLGDQPDPLEELMRAALALARGEDPPELLWDLEDGTSYRWYLSRYQDRLYLRVARVDDSAPLAHSRRPSWPGTVFEADCAITVFCSTVADRASEVIGRYGAEQFAELWLAPFNFGLLNALEGAVAAPTTT